VRSSQLKLSEWLRRLGIIPADGGLEITPTVQPVALVHDGTQHVSPLLATTAVAGFSALVPAATFLAYEFECRAPGGSFVRYAALDTSVARGFRFALMAAPAAPALARVATIYAMAGAPLSVVRGDETLAAGVLAITDPSFGRAANNSVLAMDETLFVPQGQTLRIESEIAHSGSNGFVIVWQEAPVE
jgi:hypothetical protein